MKKEVRMFKLPSEQYHMLDIIELYPMDKIICITYLINATRLCEAQVKRIINKLYEQDLIKHDIYTASKFAKLQPFQKAHEITLNGDK